MYVISMKSPQLTAAKFIILLIAIGRWRKKEGGTEESKKTSAKVVVT
jgi:hypothetical protein